MKIEAIWIVLFFMIVIPEFTSAAHPLLGDWVGTIIIAKNEVPLRLSFEEKSDVLSGMITLPAERIINSPIAGITLDSDMISFQMETPSGSMNFNGTLKSNSISGNFKKQELEGTFQLIHLFPIDAKKYFGTYELKPDRYIYIRTWDELGKNQLTLLDDSGKVAPLYASTETAFTVGSGLWMPLPVSSELTFQKDKAGNIDGLTLIEGNLPQQFAKKIQSIREEEIVFKNDLISLSGTLITPAQNGPHPAVVLVHGSGPVTRDFFGPISYVFARNGIAVLSYDKRGIGKSSGHWLDASFEDLAADALAAVNFLKTRKDINPEKIGLWGISQGGWIVPLASSQSKEIAFAILLSAAGVTPAEQYLMSMEAEMRLQDLPEDNIKESILEMKSQVESLISDEARKEFEAQVEKLKVEGNEKLLSASGIANPRFLLFFRRIMSFEPLPYLEKVNCPVLLIYGELDRTVPVEGNKD